MADLMDLVKVVLLVGGSEYFMPEGFMVSDVCAPSSRSGDVQRFLPRLWVVVKPGRWVLCKLRMLAVVEAPSSLAKGMERREA